MVSLVCWEAYTSFKAWRFCIEDQVAADGAAANAAQWDAIVWMLEDVETELGFVDDGMDDNHSAQRSR